MQSGTITALERQKRNKERVNVYLDGAYAFSLAAIEAARLHKGQQLAAGDIAALQAADSVHKAVERAVRFLSYRPRSTREVRDNLAKHDTPAAVIDEAVQRLEAQGYLDDHAFARFWVENRDTFKPMSPRALRYELKRKGVAEAAITAALDDIDAEEAAYRAAHDRAARLRGLNRQAFQQKLGGFLQRRGFAYSTCRDVIERLADELVETDPAFFAADEDEGF